MNAQPPAIDPPSATCPVHAGASELRPDDRLHLPLHQRMIVQHAVNDAGAAELRLFYRDKEISFDEPELFAFGEMLARQTSFIAAEALGWGTPGDWARVQALLQDLLDEGVLRHADDGDLDERTLGEEGIRPSPLAPARTDRPRTWHELPGLMAELVGRPLEIGWLELVVPVFRVAHMSVDAEGRQVGESNAFPAALRVDVPTRWRTCIYAGSRYQDDKPMNVSALKAMRAHWGPMMAMLLQLRAAYLARCPEAGAGWTVAHLERLSTAVLALPALQLMRRDRRVENGRLHPVLSSMFRVTDGLRMTMHHMLFIPFGEPTRKPGSPMTAPEVHAYAERAFSLHSEHGVCAGPRVMIDEFLSVLIDGRPPRDGLPETLDPELQATIADIDTAIDYAMLGLQAYATVFSLWPATMRAYEELNTLAKAWARAEPSPAVQALTDWLLPIIVRLRSHTHLATEQWRADREVVYGDMFAQTHRTRTGRLPERPLAEQLAPRAPAPGEPGATALHAAVERHFGPGIDAVQRECRLRWVQALWRYFTQAQAVVRTACAVQEQTNVLLGRETPRRPFSAADIDIYVQLVGDTEGRVPFLLTELQQAFGLRVEIDAQAIAVQDSLGMLSNEARATGTHQ